MNSSVRVLYNNTAVKALEGHPSVLKDMDVLQERHRKGELNVDEYNKALVEILQKSQGAIQDQDREAGVIKVRESLNELHTELYGKSHGLGVHEEIHAAHVLPVVRALNEKSAKSPIVRSYVFRRPNRWASFAALVTKLDVNQGSYVASRAFVENLTDLLNDLKLGCDETQALVSSTECAAALKDIAYYACYVLKPDSEVIANLSKSAVAHFQTSRKFWKGVYHRTNELNRKGLVECCEWLVMGLRGVRRSEGLRVLEYILRRCWKQFTMCIQVLETWIGSGNACESYVELESAVPLECRKCKGFIDQGAAWDGFVSSQNIFCMACGAPESTVLYSATINVCMRPKTADSGLAREHLLAHRQALEQNEQGVKTTTLSDGTTITAVTSVKRSEVLIGENDNVLVTRQLSS